MQHYLYFQHVAGEVHERVLLVTAPWTCELRCHTGQLITAREPSPSCLLSLEHLKQHLCSWGAPFPDRFGVQLYTKLKINLNLIPNSHTHTLRFCAKSSSEAKTELVYKVQKAPGCSSPGCRVLCPCPCLCCCCFGSRTGPRTAHTKGRSPRGAASAMGSGEAVQAELERVLG